MIIRAADRRDFPAIAAIHATSWQTAYRHALPDAYLAGQVVEDLANHWRNIEVRDQDVVLVAEDDAVRGFIAVWCRPDADIDNLHVLPDYRSAGMGAKLMAAAGAILMANGHRTAHLTVVDGNDRAIRFYERLGGARTGRCDIDIFGTPVPSIGMAWNDLSLIGRAVDD